MRGILAFLMPTLEPMSISVYEDNKVAIDLAKNPLSSSNSKHIDVRYHFLRELAASGDIKTKVNREFDSCRKHFLCEKKKEKEKGGSLTSRVKIGLCGERKLNLLNIKMMLRGSLTSDKNK